MVVSGEKAFLADPGGWEGKKQESGGLWLCEQQAGPMSPVCIHWVRDGFVMVSTIQCNCIHPHTLLCPPPSTLLASPQKVPLIFKIKI